MKAAIKSVFLGAAGTALSSAWCLLGSVEVSAALPYRVAAVSGEAAPGTDAGVFSNNFSLPVINAAGQTAFVSGYSGATGGGSGVWAEGTGALAAVALEGAAAPGTETDTVFNGQFYNPIINDNGSTLFLGVLSGPSIVVQLPTLNNVGLWSDRSGALDLVIRRSGQAPGMEPDRYFLYTGYHTTFNGNGHTAFYGETRGDVFTLGSNTGVWSESSGSLALIAREGDQPPGTEPGETYGHLIGQIPDLWQNPSLNDVGRIVYYGQLKGPDLHPYHEAGLWSDASGTMELIVRTGTPAPGTEPGVLFQSSLAPDVPRFINPRINNAGDISFYSFVSGPGISQHGGVWIYSDDTLRLVARKGDTVAAIPGDTAFQTIGTYPLLNGRGQVVFDGTLDGTEVDETNDRGIWLEDHGALTMIAREGDHAPGTDPDQLFSEIGDYATNGAGQVVFLSSLTGPGIDSTNSSGIWATTPNGELTLIARTGDTIDVNDDPYVDDLRTIVGFTMLNGSGGEDGRASCFNDRGQVALGVALSGNAHGIFVFETRLPGDLNGDGFVGIADLNAVLSNWNQNVPAGDQLLGDANGDGFVGIADLNEVLGNWNTGTPPAPVDDTAVIPEPAGLGMLVGLGVLCRGRNGLHLAA